MTARLVSAKPEQHRLAEMAPPIIEAHGLVKRYDGMAAVDGVDLAVAPREIFGILGPNGAGKTTTLEMIEGLRRPDAGTIRVAGIDAVADTDAVRRIIGVQLQTTALFDYLNAGELLALFAGLYGVDASAARVDDLLGLVDLREKRRSRVNKLSGGQQQRLSIALALVNQPRVVFLDEPTTGLDPKARRGLWQTVRGVRDGGATVVLTTHYMEEAEVLCDRVAIMDRGRVIACDTPAGLIRDLGTVAGVSARVAAGALPAAAVEQLPGVTSGGENDGLLRLQTTDAQATLVALLDLATRQGATLTDLASTRPTLEDVFLSLTGRHYETEQPAEDGSESSADGEGRPRSSR